LFHGLNWSLALHGRLVTEVLVAKQCLIQIEGAIEPVRLEYVSDAVFERLDPPVGLRRARCGQSVRNSQVPAQRVKCKVFSGLTFTRGK
jgi:hypothetical protein